MTRAARTAALGLAITALAPSTAGAQGGTPTVVMTGGSLYHAEDVAPNSIKTFKVTCPPGYVAISGSTSDADGATPLKAAPAGARSWSFSFGVPATASKTSHVIVLVMCTKPKGLAGGGKVKIKLKLKNKKGKTAVVPPGATRSTRLRCPRGSAPTGSGFQVAPAASGVLSNGLVARLTGDIPVRGGFRFTVRNRATVPQRVRHSGRCLYRRAGYRRRRSRRKRRAKTRIVRSTFDEMAAPGSNLFRESSPSGTTPVSTGYSYASDADMLVFGEAVGRPRLALVPLFNAEASARAIRLYLLSTPGRFGPVR